MSRLQRKTFPPGVPGTERSPLLIKTVDVRVDLDVGSPFEVQITGNWFPGAGVDGDRLKTAADHLAGYDDEIADLLRHLADTVAEIGH